MKLNVKKLRETKSIKTVTTAQALRDVERINWSNEATKYNERIICKSKD